MGHAGVDPRDGPRARFQIDPAPDAAESTGGENLAQSERSFRELRSLKSAKTYPDSISEILYPKYPSLQ
jgi:hypothetical protein